ncbi:MAG: diaminopimelate decarboxylase [Chitinivibrionales bacterium]|nr:diaminopimelate decarboxylase [Chitinivibrionales bacterium]
MVYFNRNNSELFCEDISLAAIARSVGTPAYIYSAGSIRANIGLFAKAFSAVPNTICFSIKSNSNLSVLRLVAQCGAGADIVSGGELFRALKAGLDPKKICYSGVGKTADEIRFALRSGILMINVESQAELELIAALARESGTVAPVALRINPDIDAHTHEFTTTAKKENKFGITLELAVNLYKQARDDDFLDPIGLDVHLGSPILTLDPYARAFDVCAKLIGELRALNIAIKVLDIGGGFGIRYNDETPFTPEQFAGLAVPFVKSLNCALIIEPGRFIVGNAGVLLTSITYCKQTPHGKLFYICDAGMNDLIRPPLYGSYHGIEPVILPAGGRRLVADVVGPICESSDFFAKDRSLPECKAGDVLAVMSAGAYGFSMSGNYNSRPRAVEVLVDGGNFSVIRKRETYEDLIRGE